MATTEWALGERFRSRFWRYIGGNLTRYSALSVANQRARLDGGTSGHKLTEYIVRWAYYENKGLYRTLNEYGLAFAAWPTEWNPVPATVAFYQSNVFGRDLKIAAEQEERQEAVAAAGEQVWEWSKFGSMGGRVIETWTLYTTTASDPTYSLLHKSHTKQLLPLSSPTSNFIQNQHHFLFLNQTTTTHFYTSLFFAIIRYV